MAVTARVKCNLKMVSDGQATVGFCADYADGRNKDWAKYTPFLDLRMGLKGDVADQFEPGRAYVLTFEAGVE